MNNRTPSRKKKVYTVAPFIEPRDVEYIAAKSGNVYESINIMAQRSDQITISLKEELLAKLNEFSTATDNLEEVNENKEQIEISRFYERIPHATLLSYEEFMDDKLSFEIIEEDKIFEN